MEIENRSLNEYPQSGSANSSLCYALVTPARNEEGFIEELIRCVVGQTHLPEKWVIVSDGSTDRTEEIVASYARKHSWIELVRMPERRERHFAGKVHAFNAGYARLKGVAYDVIGNLDADVSFGADQFEFLLSKFQENSRLGVAGTPFSEGGATYDYRFTNQEHVSGACQLFRRECFEAVGGYVPMKLGGIDLVAVVTARMKGWQTRTFTERICQHHRKMGSGNHRFVKATFKSGYHDYLMGVHPLWQTSRCAYQMSRKPYLVFGALLWLGYFWAFVMRAPKPVSPEFVAFRRREQMARLRKFFSKTVGCSVSTLPKAA